MSHNFWSENNNYFGTYIRRDMRDIGAIRFIGSVFVDQVLNPFPEKSDSQIE